MWNLKDTINNKIKRRIDTENNLMVTRWEGAEEGLGEKGEGI